jgi:large subunit ribosomal protein L9
MEVILLERIERLGIIGDVVRVKPGFARNFLLPQGKALRATKDNLAHFEQQKVHIEAENIKHRDEARKVAAKLEGTVLTVIRQAGQSAQLYGSVSAKDISDTFKAENVDINRLQVKIDHPIKMLGLHEVRIFLHPEVSLLVQINVAQTADEAAAQLKAAQEAAMEPEPEAFAPKKKAGKKAESEDDMEVEAASEESAAPKKKAAKKSAAKADDEATEDVADEEAEEE